MPFKNDGFNFAYELYGRKNKIILEYDVALDCALLFGISKNNGTILVPEIFNRGNVPIVKKLGEIKPTSDLIEEYKKVKEWLNEHLKVDKGLDKEIYTGVEGAVWYMIGNAWDMQKKCKADIIQDLHFLAGAGIPKHSIYITIMNAYEETDEPSFELIKEMLLEEYMESEIYKKEVLIKKLLIDISFEKKLKEKVLKEYSEVGVDINQDRGKVMRWYAGRYDKRICGKIFKILWDNYGVGEMKG